MLPKSRWEIWYAAYVGAKSISIGMNPGDATGAFAPGTGDAAGAFTPVNASTGGAAWAFTPGAVTAGDAT